MITISSMNLLESVKNDFDPSKFSIERIITIIKPLLFECKYINPIPNTTMVSIFLENTTKGFNYIDKNLQSTKDIKENNIGIPFNIEDIQYDINDIVVGEINSNEQRTDIMELIKDSTEELFDIEIIHGVNLILS